METRPNFVKKLTFALGLTIATSVVAPTTAMAETIQCPLAKIRREVTTPLPSGWWNTPIVNSLQETKIATIGGKLTLMCKYGSAGTIMRKAPTGRNCTAQRGGFNCVSGVRTFHTGQLSVRQTYTADFDQSSTNSNKADLWFQAETRDLLYLTPRNGAKIGVGNRSNRGFAGCSTARYTNSRVSLRDIPVGAYVCVKTSEGRISQFRMNNISGGSPKTITLGFTTFE